MARVAVLLKGLRCVHAIYHYHAERPMVYRPDQALLTVWLLWLLYGCFMVTLLTSG